jgi:hypothetical protein
MNKNFNINKVHFYGNKNNGNDLNNISTNILQSTIIGENSGKLATGINTTIFGYSSGFNIIKNIDCTYIGAFSGYSSIYGNKNTYVGALSGMFSSHSCNNTLIGYQANAYSYNHSYDNTIIGYKTALSNINSIGNTIIGANTAENVNNLHNNVIIGYKTLSEVLYENINNNVIIGYQSSVYETSLANSVCIGSSKINDNSIMIGHMSECSKENNILIGNNDSINSFNNISIGNRQSIKNIILFKDLLTYYDIILPTKEYFGINNIQFSEPNYIFRKEGFAGLNAISKEIYNSLNNNVNTIIHSNTYPNYQVPFLENKLYIEWNTFNKNYDYNSNILYAIKQPILITSNILPLEISLNIVYDSLLEEINPFNIFNDISYYICVEKYPEYSIIEKNIYQLNETIKITKLKKNKLIQIDSIELFPVMVINKTFEIKGRKIKHNFTLNTEIPTILTPFILYQTKTNTNISFNPNYFVTELTTIPFEINIDRTSNIIYGQLLSLEQLYDVSFTATQNGSILINNILIDVICFPEYFISEISTITILFNQEPITQLFYLETLPDTGYLTTINYINSNTGFTGTSNLCYGYIIEEGKLSSNIIAIILSNIDYIPLHFTSNIIEVPIIINNAINITIYQYGKFNINDYITELSEYDQHITKIPDNGIITKDENKNLYYRNINNTKYDTFIINITKSKLTAYNRTSIEFNITIINSYELTINDRYVYDYNEYSIHIKNKQHLYIYINDFSNVDMQNCNYRTVSNHSWINFYPIFASNIDDYNFILSNIDINNYDILRHDIYSNIYRYNGTYIENDMNQFLTYNINTTNPDYKYICYSNITISFEVNPTFEIPNLSENTFEFQFIFGSNLNLKFTESKCFYNDIAFTYNFIFNENVSNLIHMVFENNNLKIKINNIENNIEIDRNINYFGFKYTINTINTALLNNYGVSLYFNNLIITVDSDDILTYNIIVGNQIDVIGKNNIIFGKDFNTNATDSIILGKEIATGGEIYKSIIIGNDCFAKSSSKNMISIGNNVLNTIFTNIIDDIDKTNREQKLNEFFIKNPIIIGNNIKYNPNIIINIGDTILKINNNNIERILLGNNEIGVDIGYIISDEIVSNNIALRVNGGLLVDNMDIVNTINKQQIIIDNLLKRIVVLESKITL